MGKVFFTSDLHFGHENAIRFDNRPFSTVEEMDAELVRRWNAKVGKGDLVYVLGDMIWKSGNGQAEQLIKSLNGQIILIKGNHDRFLHNSKAKNALAGVKDRDDICVTLEDGTKRRCILSHDFIPMYYGHRHQAIHLHGHSHQTEESVLEFMILALLREQGLKPEIYNVGCMYWNYEPVTLDEILANRHELMAGDLRRYLAYLEGIEATKENGVFKDIKTGLQQAIDGDYCSETTLSTESEDKNG
ncbi:MAG: metallophosphoesterase [Bacteroidaceae bacterium]|nr:metallophosphoesterase [Bacteroidaceae bacterium]